MLVGLVQVPSVCVFFFFFTCNCICLQLHPWLNTRPTIIAADMLLCMLAQNKQIRGNQRQLDWSSPFWASSRLGFIEESTLPSSLAIFVALKGGHNNCYPSAPTLYGNTSTWVMFMPYENWYLGFFPGIYFCLAFVKLMFLGSCFLPSPFCSCSSI